MCLEGIRTHIQSIYSKFSKDVIVMAPWKALGSDSKPFELLHHC